MVKETNFLSTCAITIDIFTVKAKVPGGPGGGGGGAGPEGHQCELQCSSQLACDEVQNGFAVGAMQFSHSALQHCPAGRALISSTNTSNVRTINIFFG